MCKLFELCELRMDEERGLSSGSNSVVTGVDFLFCSLLAFLQAWKEAADDKLAEADSGF